MRADVLDCYPFVEPEKVKVVYNGIDVSVFKPTQDDDVLRKHGIDPSRPFVLFVGRITRQKGLIHLLRAAKTLLPGVQLVLAASSPDEKSIGDEVASAVAELRSLRPHDVIWIENQVNKTELIVLLTQASVFACPSVYEPLGIVNLEAMACGTTVVASSVGGIPEVVVDGETGFLVDYTPDDVALFEASLSESLNRAVADEVGSISMGAAGRIRAMANFDWAAIAHSTVDIYKSVMK
jgi:starch synthase